MFIINCQANIYLFKVNNRNTRKICEICSTIEFVLVFLLLTLNIFYNNWRRSGVYIVHFEEVNVSWLFIFFAFAFVICRLLSSKFGFKIEDVPCFSLLNPLNVSVAPRKSIALPVFKRFYCLEIIHLVLRQFTYVCIMG